MDLVMDICDSIIVLNLGKKLTEGTPREIQENPAVDFRIFRRGLIPFLFLWLTLLAASSASSTY